MASWVDRVCARVSHDVRVSQQEGSCATMSATPLLRPKDVLVSASPNAATGEPCAGARVYTPTLRTGALQHNGSVDGDKNCVREEQGVPEEKTVVLGANRSFATRPVDIRRPSSTSSATGKPQHADSEVTACTNSKEKLLHFSTDGGACRHMLCAAKPVGSEESQATRAGATTTTYTLERQVTQLCSAHLPEVQGAGTNSLNKHSQPDLHSVSRSPWLEAVLSTSSHSAVKQPLQSRQQQQQQPTSPRHGSSSDVRHNSTENDLVEPNPATEPGAMGVPASSRETHDGKGEAMGVEPRKTALDTEAAWQPVKPSGWTRGLSELVTGEDETSTRTAPPITGKSTMTSQSNAPWLQALLSAPAPVSLPSKGSQSLCSQPISRGCTRLGTSNAISRGWVGASKGSGTALLSSAPVASSPFVGCEAPGEDALKTSGSPRPSSPELIPATSGSQAEIQAVLEGADENQESEGVDDDSSSCGVDKERDGAARRVDESVSGVPERGIEEGEVLDPEEESSAPNKTSRRIYFGSEHGKVKFLFPNMSPGRRDQLQFDEESLWSVTDQNTADEITKISLMLPGVTSRTTIVDGTACVGGNVISFAEAFAEVWAVEIDRDRFELLVSNVENCLGGPGNPAGVRFLNGDFLNVLQQEKEKIGAKRPVIFLDPPWGGVDYKKQDVVDLFLSGVSLADVCGRAAEAGARYVLVKVPTNFNLRSFRMAVGLAGRITVFERNLRKMLLIAVEFYGSSSPSSPSSRAMSRRASETPAGSPSLADCRVRSESEGGRDGRRVGACLGPGATFPGERYRLRQRGEGGIVGCWGGKPPNHRFPLAPGTSSSSGGCVRWEGHGGSCSSRAAAATAYEGGDEPMGSWIERRANARAISQREKPEGEGLEAMYTSRVEREAVYSERMNGRPGAGGVGVLPRYGGRRRVRGGADARSVENVRKMLKEVLGLDGSEDGGGAPSREPCSGIDGHDGGCKVNNRGGEMAAGERRDRLGGSGEVGRGAAGSPAEDDGDE